ncbi:FtsW/RodA/SpoVE family cell cycle protein, partial [Enterococcus sp. DIV0098]
MKKKVEINYAILLPVFLLCILGLLSLYVALKLDNKSISYIQNALIKQTIWLFLGLAIALICSFLSPKFLWKLAPYAYVACVIILILLLKYYDQNLFVQTGAKNWFNFGGITFQPTEIVKIGFILILAKIATQRAEYSTIKQDMLFLFKMFLAFLPIAILLLLQNDFGTLLVFISIFIFIFLLSGA